MRIVIAGLYMPASGLTSVMLRLASCMTEEADVTVMGFDPLGGSERLESADGVIVHIYPARGGRLFLSRDAFDKVMADHPDILILSGPVPVVRGLLTLAKAHPTGTRIVLYLPTEGRISSPAILETLLLADDCILFTESARRDLELLISAHGCPSLRLGVVGHGIDYEAFYPLDLRDNIVSRHAIRETFWSSNDPHEVVIVNVNRAYTRKRLDLSIAGFSSFARSGSPCRLVLHLGHLRDGERLELDQWIQDGGVPDQITILPDAPLTIERLNLLYNVCDIGLTTAMGEGWGLTCFEMAATGMPLIVPNHTSFSENWSGAAVMLAIESPPQTVFYEYADMFPTSPLQVHGALERLVPDAAERQRMGELALRRSREPRHSWSQVGSKLLSILLPSGVRA